MLRRDEAVNFNVDSRTIYRVVHGSHAYGLATPESDLDEKGICIEPLDHHIGFLHRFEQQERMANKGHHCDSVVYSLKKFVKLAVDANPNIIEVLWVDDEHVRSIDSFGQHLRDIRELFVSKKARFTFASYAHSQIKRIETHRRWLLHPPTHKPSRAEFDLPEHPIIPTGQLQTAQALVQKHLDRWQFNDMSQIDPPMRTLIQATLAEMLAEAQVGADERYRATCRFLGFDENFLELLSRERRYRQASDEWTNHQNWLKNRNPKRAAGERESGYDLKHASQCLRLMRMCKEILAGKGVLVDRRSIDAEELIAIKMHGAMKYEDLLAEVERLNTECDELYRTSSLKHEPDRRRIDDIVVQLTFDYLRSKGEV